MQIFGRRQFLKSASNLSIGLFLQEFPIRDFHLSQKDRRNPEGKGVRIDPAWISALYDCGSATTYLKSRDELHYIGMPVGGLHAGTLYVGGDGKLWLWDIFNLNQEGINPLDLEWGTDVLHAGKKIRSRDGSAYVAPARADELCPLDQGFAIQFDDQGRSVERRLCAADWKEVKFEAGYPIAKITYLDSDLPIIVEMEVYSPFIPLDEANSSFPATICSIRIHSRSNEPIQVKVAGWLENKTAPYSAKPGKHMRANKSFQLSEGVGVESLVYTVIKQKDKIETPFDYGSLYR